MNLIIQTCVPSYRLNIFKEITSKNNNVSIISGNEFYASSIKSDKRTPNVIWIKNVFLLNRKLLFQKLPWVLVFKAKSVIIEFNLRNISFYFVFLIRLVLNKKTYLWGHAWSRGGKKSKSEYLRYFFKKTSSGYIAYTEKQKQELRQQLPNKNIYAACNAIYFKNEMTPIIKDSKEITNFIYVGRLVKDKKIMLLIKAFNSIIDELPKESKLLIVGNGDQFSQINDYCTLNKLSKRIILLGEVSDYTELKELYSKSIASISPGYVGLSITQSLGFGVPMLISKDEPHSPELEAANIGVNSKYFNTNNTDDLARELLQFYNEKEKWISKRNQISEDCRNLYSIEKMAIPFLNICMDNE